MVVCKIMNYAPNQRLWADVTPRQLDMRVCLCLSTAGCIVCSFHPSDCQESTRSTVSSPLHTLHPASHCPVSTSKCVCTVYRCFWILNEKYLSVFSHWFFFRPPFFKHCSWKTLSMTLIVCLPYWCAQHWNSGILKILTAVRVSSVSTFWPLHLAEEVSKLQRSGGNWFNHYKARNLTLFQIMDP